MLNSARGRRFCRSFPDPGGDGLQAGARRNYQILSPLDFLAEFTQHIPAKGSHLIRYYGWYSNKSRGMRKKAAEAAGSAKDVEDSSATVGAEEASSSRSRQSWAMLIKRVYEIDPLSCPQCGGQMTVISRHARSAARVHAIVSSTTAQTLSLNGRDCQQPRLPSIHHEPSFSLNA